MKRYTKAVSVIILIMSVIYASGCKKYYWSGEGGFITLDVSGNIGGYEYVDLGLPSGLLWATCNVGARTPEKDGESFAWGGIWTGGGCFDWDCYHYCMGSKNTLTKYCNEASNGYNGYTDDLTILISEDDAAAVNWGSGWRMPTIEEWEELIEHIPYKRTGINGVDGILFTSSNGNMLFLPGLNNGEYHYWSSSLDTESPLCALDFEIEYDYAHVWSWCRYHYLSIRAVHSALQN